MVLWNTYPCHYLCLIVFTTHILREMWLFFIINRTYRDLMAIEKSKSCNRNCFYSLISIKFVVNEKTNNLGRISDRMLWIWPTQRYETLHAMACSLGFLQPRPLNYLAFQSFELIWYLRFYEACKNICGQKIHSRHVGSKDTLLTSVAKWYSSDKGYTLNMWDNMIHPRHLWAKIQRGNLGQNDTH